MVSKLELIRHDLETVIGSKVRIITKEGRKRISSRRGVIEKTYPSVFVVKFDNNKYNDETGRCSYNYSDLLTHDVELTVLKSAE